MNQSSIGGSMKIKNVILAMLIMPIGLSQSIVAVPAKSSVIKEAKAKFARFRRSIECMLKGKSCTPKQRKKIILGALGLAATVAAITGTAIFGIWYKKRKQEQTSSQPSEPPRYTLDPSQSNPLLKRVEQMEIPNQYIKVEVSLPTGEKEELRFSGKPFHQDVRDSIKKIYPDLYLWDFEIHEEDYGVRIGFPGNTKLYLELIKPLSHLETETIFSTPRSKQAGLPQLPPEISKEISKFEKEQIRKESDQEHVEHW